MIEMLLLDVDGTLSDGKIYYGDRGEEFKVFDVKDGLGLRIWKKLGKKSAIITGRCSLIVERRAKELGIDEIFMGVENKADVVRSIKAKYNFCKENIACIGDDYNDLPMFKESGLRFSPSNAIEEIKRSADIVLSKKGGDGAVREMIEHIIKQEGLEGKWLEFFA